MAYVIFKKDDPNQKVGIFLSDLQGRSPLQYYSFPICMELQRIMFVKREEYLNQDQPCTSWEQSLHPNEDWLKSEMFITMTRIVCKIEKVIYAVKFRKEMDKAFQNTWKGALSCWRRRGWDNSAGNPNTCELSCACEHSPERETECMMNYPERYMPPGTSLWDVLASLLLVQNRGNSCRHWLADMLEDRLKLMKQKISQSSPPALHSFPECKYVPFSCFFKEENQIVPAFNRHL